MLARHCCSDPRRARVILSRASNAANRVLRALGTKICKLSTRGALSCSMGPERLLATAIGNRQKKIIGYIMFQTPRLSVNAIIYVHSIVRKVCTVPFFLPHSHPFVAYHRSKLDSRSWRGVSLIKLRRKSQPALQSKTNELQSCANKKNHSLEFAKLHFLSGSLTRTVCPFRQSRATSGILAYNFAAATLVLTLVISLYSSL